MASNVGTPGDTAKDIDAMEHVIQGVDSAPTVGTSTDLISQLESDLALVLQIMSSSLHFIANRSAHVQLNADIPLFHAVTGVSADAARQLLDPAAMHENIEELTDDLVGKAKEMERGLQSLPRQSDEDAVKQDMVSINAQMVDANAEYRAALQEETELREEMDSLLRHLCDEHQAGRARLAVAATSSTPDTAAS